ncbi:amino acid ABC transporter substrate-binding protein [Advenella sp. S44]|uniref:Amino acid ABC transporter substrate-binding protein n=1 Tax=Advenella kashmirensis TaxID=310575 RepID=A0A356LAS2_9BURK|nr:MULTISPECIES: amino acid ABC transporter substrate-binding protein [unclassified Advenella]PJX20284.1 amino acid ABC transporter substrate-binding protein [Advenella sp. S44]HBP28096.1 amino acid ABC transporter substrate-binding protein [Advenella kashmirensis]
MKTSMFVAALTLIASTCATAQPVDTLSKIKQKNEIALGVRETAQPFSYLDASHQFVGYSVDLCLKVVEGIKTHLNQPDLKIRMVPIASSNRIPLMANGTIDLECGTTSNTVERQKQVAFSSTIFVSSTRFVSKKSANLADLSSLAGKAVVATAGSSNIRQITALNVAHKYGMRIAPARDFAEGFLMMETDRAAAFFLDDITLAGLVANAKTPDAYVISKTPLSVEPYALMMRKGDASFKRLVDDVLKSTFASNTIDGIYAKWFESAIPPKSINLRVPMSPALRRAIATPTDSTDAASYQ